MMILDNAAEKVDAFNSTGIHYEAVYHYVIRRRQELNKLLHPNFIDDITAGLISFDMQRMMGSEKYLFDGKKSWASKLQKVLSPHKQTLQGFRSHTIQDVDFTDQNFKKKIIDIFNELSKSGSQSLSLRKESERFPVGASKILHFLIPDLFIIVDSNARRELAIFHGIKKSRKFDGDLYFSAMKKYRDELDVWKSKSGDNNFHKLLKLDSSHKKFAGVRTTPLPRIIDKCTFIGSVEHGSKVFLPQKFSISIGGYFGGSYSVELKNGNLIYKVFGDEYQLNNVKEILPTNQQWGKFWDQLNRLSFWKWDAEYPNPGFCDGTQWQVDIKYENKILMSRGDNNYPESSRGTSNDEFDLFLKAIEQLLDGESFK